MMLYRAAPKPVLEVAKELGATHVIEGSVRREGNRVRLTLQLIDGRTDNHLWAQTYDRTLKDALTLQSDVALEVASQLAVQLAGGDEPARAPTTDPEAYDLYLKARLVRKQLNPVSFLADIQRIDSLLSRAIARDPNFGMAYVELANHTLSNYLSTLISDATTEDRLRQARANLDAAERLIPGDATLKATEVLYRHIMGTDRTVEPIIEATAQAGVDSLNLYYLDIALVQAGRFDDSLALVERWARLDPASILILQLYASELALVRKPKEALRIYDLVNARSDSDFYAAVRARTLFAYTGKIKDLRAAIDRQGSIVAPDVKITREFDALRFERRYEDLKRLLGETSLDASSLGWNLYLFFLGAGLQPVAEMRGWTALLLGDAQSAAAEARALTSFIAAAPRLPTNGWYLRTLAAEAHLFAGEKAEAIAAARECLALAPRAQDVLTWHSTAASAASVFAWAGAQDEAMDLLEQLATVNAGLGPRRDHARSDLRGAACGQRALSHAVEASRSADGSDQARLKSAAFA